MATRQRNRKGQFVKRGARKNAARRRPTRTRAVARKKTRRARRNPWATGGPIVANPRRRRRAQRNPKLLGFELPNMTSLAFTTAGFIGTPFVEGAVSPFLPETFRASALGRWSVRLGTVFLASWAIKQFVGSSEGKAVLLGGSAYAVTMGLAELGVLPGTGTTQGVGMYVEQANQARAMASARRPALREYVRSNQRVFNPMGRRAPRLPGRPAINQTPPSVFVPYSENAAY